MLTKLIFFRTDNFLEGRKKDGKYKKENHEKEEKEERREGEVSPEKGYKRAEKGMV
jgi:hypothetical protein